MTEADQKKRHLKILYDQWNSTYELQNMDRDFGYWSSVKTHLINSQIHQVSNKKDFTM